MRQPDWVLRSAPQLFRRWPWPQAKSKRQTSLNGWNQFRLKPADRVKGIGIYQTPFNGSYSLALGYAVFLKDIASLFCNKVGSFPAE